MRRLLLGTAKIDITPPSPVRLAGFSSRMDMGAFERIASPIYARILLFRSDDPDNSYDQAGSALIVSADLIWWGNGQAAALRKRISDKWGIPERHIMLHGTHSHSGPMTTGELSSWLGVADGQYVGWLERQVLDGIAQAFGKMDAVTLERGQAAVAAVVNRRLMKDGEPVMEPNPDGSVDPELTVIRCKDRAGKTKALLIHFACHPVITRENSLSGEFPGAAMDMVERAGEPGMVAAYLQGYCGDIHPERDGRFLWNGTDREVEWMARVVSDRVRQITDGGMQALKLIPIAAKQTRLPLLYQRLPSGEQLARLSLRSEEAEGEWAGRLLADPALMRESDTLELNLVTIADGLSLLAANAEMVVEYGLQVKKLSAGRVLPLGYTNGMIGYVCTAKQIQEGGYEPVESTTYFLQPAPFDPVIESDVRRGLKQLSDI